MKEILGKGVLRDGLLGQWKSHTPHLPFHSIAIASGKGGTGKSVFTASLGSYFASQTYQVTLFDADLGVGNAHILQGICPTYTAAHVISGLVELEDIAVRAPSGVKVLPAGSGVAGLASLNVPALQQITRGFERVEKSCDLLLVDSAAGISDQTLFFLLAADVVILVTTPDLTAMTDAYALIKIFHQRSPSSKLTLVVNRAQQESEALNAANKIASVSKRFLGKEIIYLGWIPDDHAVVESVAKKTPFYLLNRETAASQAIERISEKLIRLRIPKSQLGNFASKAAK